MDTDVGDNAVVRRVKMELSASHFNRLFGRVERKLGRYSSGFERRIPAILRPYNRNDRRKVKKQGLSLPVGDPWLSGWSRRKSHVINAATGAGTLYQTCIKVYKGVGTDGTETTDGVTAGKVYCGGNCRDDFGDIRFTDDDQITLLDYWMRTYTSGVSAVFWVEVQDDLGTANRTIYVYYNKSDAITTSNGDNTFILFTTGATDEFASHFTVVDGTWAWDSGGYYKQTNTAISARARFQVNSQSNYAVIADVQIYSSPTEWTGGLYLYALADASHFYRFQMYAYSTYKRLHITHEGTVLTFKNVTYALRTVWRKLEFRNAGGAMLGFVDDVQELSTSDSTHTSGYPMLYAEKSVVWFKNIRMRKYVSPEPSHGAWGGEEYMLPTVTDSGVGTDVVASIEVPTQDSGVGVDIPTVEGQIPVSDSGVGVDVATKEVVGVPIDVFDSGSGIDTPTVESQVPIADSGLGVDTSSIEANIPVSDSGIGTDQVQSIEIPIGDSGVGVDVSSVSAEVQALDSGIGVDTPLVETQVPVSDTGVGVDTPLIEGQVTAQDFGVGVDIVTSVEILVQDSGVGVEIPSVQSQVQVTDLGSGVEVVSVEGQIVVVDLGVGVDVPSLLGQIPVSDLGVGVDAATAEREVPVQDSGIGVDSVWLVRKPIQRLLSPVRVIPPERILPPVR